MIYCPSCGTANRDGSRFCNHCGGDISHVPSAPPPLADDRPVPPEEAALLEEQPWLAAAEPDAVAPDQVAPEVAELIREQPWLAGVEQDEPALAAASSALPAEDVASRLHLAATDGHPGDAPTHTAWDTAPTVKRHPRRPIDPPYLFYALLLAAVALPLILQPLPFWREAELQPPIPAIPAAVQAAFQAVDALPREAVVLVAWDYDPTTAGEMNLLADALVGHVIGRGAQLVVLSLLPAGPPLAQAEIARLIEGTPSLAAVRPRPIQLGYVPGGDIALGLISSDPLQAMPATSARDSLQRRLLLRGRSLTGLANVDLLLVLTADADDGRAWVEQVTSRTGAPTVIGASAAAAPGLAPYQAAGQVVGLVNGYDGALAYQSLRGGHSTSAGACVDAPDRPAVCETLWSQWGGQGVLLLALIVGGGAAVLARRRRARP